MGAGSVLHAAVGVGGGIGGIGRHACVQWSLGKRDGLCWRMRGWLEAVLEQAARWGARGGGRKRVRVQQRRTDAEEQEELTLWRSICQPQMLGARCAGDKAEQAAC